MPKFQIKGHDFTLPPIYSPGHILTQGQAEILNKLATKTLRETIAVGLVKTRAEAELWLQSNAALGPTQSPTPEAEADLSELDELL